MHPSSRPTCEAPAAAGLDADSLAPYVDTPAQDTGTPALRADALARCIDTLAIDIDTWCSIQTRKRSI